MTKLLVNIDMSDNQYFFTLIKEIIDIKLVPKRSA